MLIGRNDAYNHFEERQRACLKNLTIPVAIAQLSLPKAVAGKVAIHVGEILTTLGRSSHSPTASTVNRKPDRN